MKRLIATGLVAFQILGVSAFAADTTPAPTTNTPEKALLESLIALEGQNLPQNELEARMNADLTAYSQQASAEGQQARMEQAFVDLRILTPAQAQSLVADSQGSVAQLMDQAQASPNPQALQSSVQATMNELATLHPVGAEFSSCAAKTVGDIGVVAFTGGLASVVAGGILDASGHSSVGDPMMTWGGLATAAGAITVTFCFFASLACID